MVGGGHPPGHELMEIVVVVEVVEVFGPAGLVVGLVSDSGQGVVVGGGGGGFMCDLVGLWVSVSSSSSSQSVLVSGNHGPAPVGSVKEKCVVVVGAIGIGGASQGPSARTGMAREAAAMRMVVEERILVVW